MAKRTGRLVSLDIFRGMTIAFMIIVITPGSWKYVYPPLRHASWHGWTPADLVFPFFLFIVGGSLWFSMKKYGQELNSRSLIRIFRRTVTIFTLGLFLAIFPHFSREYSTLRIMGVLQRIAIAYCIGAIICLTVNRDYLWIVIAVILIGYWIILGIFGGSDPYSLEGNIAAEFDVAILGKNHLYKGYGIPFDPEGLLSTLPAICTVVTGYYVGELTGKGAASWNTSLKFFLLGASSVGLGMLWSIWFPLNKPLWTSSFVLCSTGIAMAGFAIIYMIADVWKLRKWDYFFLVFGTNALLSYFLAGIWARIMLNIKIMSGETQMTLYNWIYEKICVPVAGNMNGSLMFALLQVLIIWLLVMILYRKKIMIRL